MAILLTGGRIFLGDRIINNTGLMQDDNGILHLAPVRIPIIDHGREIVPHAMLSAEMLIVPSFTDLQVNGCGGVMFNSAPEVDTLQIMYETCLRSGTTTFLPTLVTSSRETMISALEAVRQFHRRHGRRHLPGAHLEGPFISPAKSGIHDQKHIRHLDEATLELLLEYAPEIAMLTLSPEMATPEQMAALQEAGIILSLGHSACPYDTALPLLSRYFRCATHLYNAMTLIPNGRDPGMLCAASAAGLYAGIIADGFHVHPDLVRLAFRIFGSRLCLVTDALASAGAPADLGPFEFCGKTVYPRPEGYCSDENGTLAGSSLTMDQGVRILASKCGLTLEEALNAASAVPAEILGLTGQGRITDDVQCDLTLLDADLNAAGVISGGEPLWYTESPVTAEH